MAVSGNVSDNIFLWGTNLSFSIVNTAAEVEISFARASDQFGGPGSVIGYWADYNACMYLPRTSPNLLPGSKGHAGHSDYLIIEIMVFIESIVV